MKFGKQLKVCTYEPWKDYYIQYSKLKRIINRRKFVLDRYKETSIRVSREYHTHIGIDSFYCFKRVGSQSDVPSSGFGGSHSSSIQMVGLGGQAVNELTPLNTQINDRIAESMLQTPVVIPPGKGNGGQPDFSDESIDFFKVIVDEMNKINNFFVGKLAELRISLDEINRCCFKLVEIASITQPFPSFAQPKKQCLQNPSHRR